MDDTRKNPTSGSAAGAEPGDPRAYRRLAAATRSRIRDGELRRGQALPSIAALRREQGHARQTCSHAYQLLEDEGLVRRVPGLGYFVA